MTEKFSFKIYIIIMLLTAATNIVCALKNSGAIRLLQFFTAGFVLVLMCFTIRSRLKTMKYLKEIELMQKDGA